VLERSASPPTRSLEPFHRRHQGGLVAIGAGLISLIAAFIMQFGGSRNVTEIPNPWVTGPLLLVALGGVGWAFFRREPHRFLPVAGLGVALGWVVVACAVAAGAALLCLLIAKFM
jgi:hypothetical protein